MLQIFHIPTGSCPIYVCVLIAPHCVGGTNMPCAACGLGAVLQQLLLPLLLVFPHTHMCLMLDIMMSFSAVHDLGEAQHPGGPASHNSCQDRYNATRRLVSTGQGLVWGVELSQLQEVLYCQQPSTA